MYLKENNEQAAHMVLEKLLKLSIMDALDQVWSEAGITPSKKTRETILEAAEKISNNVEEDSMMANKKEEVDSAALANLTARTHSTRTRSLSPELSVEYTTGKVDLTIIPLP
jgi:hypothetical protein